MVKIYAGYQPKKIGFLGREKQSASLLTRERGSEALGDPEKKMWSQRTDQDGVNENRAGLHQLPVDESAARVAPAGGKARSGGMRSGAPPYPEGKKSGSPIPPPTLPIAGGKYKYPLSKHIRNQATKISKIQSSGPSNN